MREIKFRGWDAEGRKGWVYRDLVHNKKCNRDEPYLTDRVMVGGYEVVLESVGQFTGLKDRYGKDIYEGDIVQWSKDGKKYLVVFKSGMFYASVEEFNKGVYGGFPLWVLCEEEAISDASEFSGLKIVGNEFERDK